MINFIWNLDLGIIRIGWRDKFLSCDYPIQIGRLCIDLHERIKYLGK